MDRTIDLNTWPRHSHYTFFRGYERPHFSLTAAVDATLLMRDGKPAGVPVFNAALYAIMTAVNAVPELRTRFRGEVVTEYAVVHASTTVPVGTEAFAFCDVRYAPDWNAFNTHCAAEVAAAKTQTELVNNVAHDDDWIYLSCLPWVAFTEMTHPLAGRDDCIPRIAWGKMTETDGRWSMPVNLTAHHALVDGLHAARFFAGVEERLADPFW